MFSNWIKFLSQWNEQIWYVLYMCSVVNQPLTSNNYKCYHTWKSTNVCNYKNNKLITFLYLKSKVACPCLLNVLFELVKVKHMWERLWSVYPPCNLCIFTLLLMYVVLQRQLLCMAFHKSDYQCDMYFIYFAKTSPESVQHVQRSLQG